MIQRILLLLCLLSLPGLAKPQPSADIHPDLRAMATIPAQEGGRLKPLDTVALESVRRITGKASFQGEEPLWTCLRWIGDPEAASSEATIECRNLALKEALGLKPEQRWFSLNELSGSPKFQEMQTSMQQRLGNGSEEPTPQDKQFQELLGRMQALASILDGQAWKIVPHATSMQDEWQPLTSLQARMGEPDVASCGLILGNLLRAAHDHDAAGLQTASVLLGPALARLGPTPSAAAMAMEVHYNHLHPFRIAWALYALALCPLLFAQSSSSRLYGLGLATALIGFGVHIYGFYLRCSISGRPPVTNMYESVVWVAFGAVLFALIFEFRYRARYYLQAALTFSIVALVLVDNLPAVLDPGIRPLMPVLRNNFWLTIHVLTITLSYAAFALALGLGHMVVWGYAFRPQAKERLAVLNKALYKAIQVGILLLAAGTILGGVWANYSWGRFWGWDPKEVWALIALLGYLALLHGRFAGWLGHYGLAAGSILAFMGVMMAWYGVNYVLGAGLHSYGFGSGGVQYVGAFVAAELAFVAFTTLRVRRLRS